MNFIPLGFKAVSTKAGIFSRKNKHDMCLFYSPSGCTSAGVFTKNRVKAAPVLLSKKNIRSGNANVLLINSGNANAATGKRGLNNVYQAASLCARILKVPNNKVLVASTGVIGEFLNMRAVLTGIKRLGKEISNQNFKEKDFISAAESMMTTDTFSKTTSRKMTVNNKTIVVWGCAKGAGMIHPDMATMLSVFLTDARLSPSVARKLLKEITDESFNGISVDGDTSTNDSVFLMANGCSKMPLLAPGKEGWQMFKNALLNTAKELAVMIVSDGEGATHVIKIDVEKALSKTAALAIAKTVATSPLVKTAICGADANWGRIIAAVGRSGVKINPDKIDIYLGKHMVCKNGTKQPYSEKTLKNVVRKQIVSIRIVLHQGTASARYLTSDLTEEYIQINAHYRT